MLETYRLILQFIINIVRNYLKCNIYSSYLITFKINIAIYLIFNIIILIEVEGY